MVRLSDILAVIFIASCATEMPKLTILDEISPWRLMGGETKTIPPPETRCLNAAPGYNLHPVVACETDNSYVLRVGEVNRTYSKSEMKEKLRAEIYHFLRKKNYPLLSLRDAVIEIWVFAPAFNPLQAEYRAFLISGAGNLLFTLPVELRGWEPTSKDVTFLGKFTYPETEQIWYPRILGTETRFFAFRFFS